MQLETKKFLYDISISTEKLKRFTQQKSWNDYLSNDLLKAGVERQFEIIGEALNQLDKIDHKTASKITDYQQIISFRNILIHGYAEIDDRLVWNIVETKLPTLIKEISRLESE